MGYTANELTCLIISDYRLPWTRARKGLGYGPSISTLTRWNTAQALFYTVFFRPRYHSFWAGPFVPKYSSPTVILIGYRIVSPAKLTVTQFPKYIANFRLFCNCEYVKRSVGVPHSRSRSFFIVEREDQIEACRLCPVNKLPPFSTIN